MPLFYVHDENGPRAYPTLGEAMADAEEQICEYRKEAKFDGEWSLSVEEVAVFRCEFETDDPAEDGTQVARAVQFDKGIDEDTQEEYCDYRMEAYAGSEANSAASLD